MLSPRHTPPPPGRTPPPPGRTPPPHGRTPEFETSLRFFDPQAPNELRDHKVTIHPYDRLLTTKWKDWPAWRIFREERVVCIDRHFPDGLLKMVSSPEWRHNTVKLHDDEWAYKLRNENQELKSFNEDLLTYCRHVLDSLFLGLPEKNRPKLTKLLAWLVRHEENQVPPPKEGEPREERGFKPLHMVHGDFNPKLLPKGSAVYNIHFFLDKINMGAGLAFALGSSISHDMSEIVMGRSIDPDASLDTQPVLVRHKEHHIWTSVPQMPEAYAMVFCSASSDNDFSPHSAYHVEPKHPGFKPRCSFELRMLVDQTNFVSASTATLVPLAAHVPPGSRLPLSNHAAVTHVVPAGQVPL